MAKYLTEFIGTFFLVLTIGLCVCQEVPMAPLAIGCALMIMVYMGGHISGAHYNPAVSLGAMMRGAMSSVDLIPYWIAQVAGSLAAAAVVAIIFGGLGAVTDSGATSETSDETAMVQFDQAYVSTAVVHEDAPAEKPNAFFGPAPGDAYSLTDPAPWIIEILFTFALVLVVLNVATSSGTAGNSYYGLAIGFTVVVGAFAGGPISGGAFNPAVGIGPNVIKGILGGETAAMGNIMLHTIGPFIGGILAVVVFKIQEAFVNSKASAA